MVITTPANSRKISGFHSPFREGFWPRGVAQRGGLYARVSTHDQQTLPMQLSAMRDYVQKREWQVAIEIRDI